MHPHEEATIRAFIVSPRKARWLEALASAKRRARFLARLNPCRDLDERFIQPVEHVAAELTARGAPAMCHVISASSDLDGRDLPLAEALEATECGGWGTLISCVPGELA